MVQNAKFLRRIERTANFVKFYFIVPVLSTLVSFFFIQFPTRRLRPSSCSHRRITVFLVGAAQVEHRSHSLRLHNTFGLKKIKHDDKPLELPPSRHTHKDPPLAPIRILLQFKRVSKEWKAIINDPKFFNRYHDKSLTLFVSKGSLFCVLVRHTEDNKPAVDPPCTVRCIPIRLEGQVNGTLRLVSEPSDTMACVVLANYRFLLYNLFTGASHTVADAPVRLGLYTRWSCYGFGYDHYVDDHKITVVVKMDPKTMIDTDVGFEREGDIRFWIYSFRNQAWNKRRLEGFPYTTSYWIWRYRACSSNGVLHWVFSLEQNEGKPGIVTYDLRTRGFGEMSAPPMPDRSYWMQKLYQVGGQLCYGYMERCVFHVWVMKEYGFKESWAKLFRVDKSSLFAIDKLRLRDDPLDGYLMTSMALCEPRDGEKVAVFRSHSNRHLIWYDVKDGSAKVVDYETNLEK